MAYLQGYKYRKLATLAGTTAGAQTDYQMKMTVYKGAGVDGVGDVYLNNHCRDHFNDIRWTATDGVTELDHWRESYTSGVSAVFWVKVPNIPADPNTVDIYIYYDKSDALTGSSPGDAALFGWGRDFRPGKPAELHVEIDTAVHSNYGCSYPLTYVFWISADASSLQAYRKFSVGGAWTQITEKSASDFFNGIEAVRFDYANQRAYVSVAFDAASDEIYIKVTDASGDLVGAYLGTSKYYDNRVCACAMTWDDWDGDATRDAAFQSMCDAHTSRNIWASLGIVTQGIAPAGAPTWANIQGKVEAGHVEPCSHSRTHSNPAGWDEATAESEVGGSKSDILDNLDMPDLNKKGATEYLYGFIEPYGATGAWSEAKQGEHRYLGDRRVDDLAPCPYYAGWDPDDKWDRMRPSNALDGDTAATMNGRFDDAYNNGGIYLGSGHPVNHTWTPGQPIMDHLDYIKDKTNVWYVGFGHLHAYRFTAWRVRTNEMQKWIRWGGWAEEPSEQVNNRLDLVITGSADACGVVPADSESIYNLEIRVLGHNTAISRVALYLCLTRPVGDSPYYEDDWYRIMMYEATTFYVQRKGVAPLYSGALLGTEENMRIRVEDGTIRFYEENTERANEAWGLPSRDCYLYLEGAGSSGHVGTDWEDTLWTRKWADPEPTWDSWGPEDRTRAAIHSGTAGVLII